MERKEKICNSCDKPKIIFGHGLCQNCYNIAQWKYSANGKPARTLKDYIKGNMQSPEVVKAKAKKQKSERSRAMNTADTWFSRYIRLKYSFVGSDGELYCKCFTSGKIRPVTKTDCGHFAGRANLQTRYHKNNARPQRQFDNRHREGEKVRFRMNMVQEIGEAAVEQIEKLSQIAIPVNALEFRKKADYYRGEVNKMLAEKGVMGWWNKKN